MDESRTEEKKKKKEAMYNNIMGDYFTITEGWFMLGKLIRVRSLGTLGCLLFCDYFGRGVGLDMSLAGIAKTVRTA